MSDVLEGKRTAFLATDGVERRELEEPLTAVPDAVVAPKSCRCSWARSVPATTISSPQVSSASTARSATPWSTTTTAWSSLVAP
jgi:hypothetical protein